MKRCLERSTFRCKINADYCARDRQEVFGRDSLRCDIRLKQTTALMIGRRIQLGCPGMTYKIKADYCACEWKEDSSSDSLKCYIVLQHIVMMHCITHALRQYRS